MSTPIPITTPAVIRTTAAANSGAGFLNAIYNAVDQAGTHWEVKKYTPNVGLILGQMAGGNQYIWIVPFPGSANNMRVAIDPNGKIHDPDATIANFADPVGTSSSGWSDWATVFSGNDPFWDADQMSGKIDIVEVDDCISVFFYGARVIAYNHGPQEDLWYHGFQVGKIMSPDNPLEEQFGLDGLGIVCGPPTVFSNSRYSWVSDTLAFISGVAVASNRIRTGLTSWANFVSLNSGDPSILNVATVNTWNSVDGKLRLVPATIALPTGQILGRSKYFRLMSVEAEAATVYKVASDVTHGGHQAWIQRTYVEPPSSYNNNLVHLWTVMPITEV